MLYRNEKTGVVIRVSSKLGGNWKRIDVEPVKAPVISVPEPVEVIEETKIDKPKRTRKTKTKK